MTNEPFVARGKTLMTAGLMLAAVLLLPACERIAKLEGKAPVYTLYQSNPTDLMARLRFATFDIPEEPNLRSKDDEPINQHNCEMTANTMNDRARQGNFGPLTAHYWCEKGHYKEQAS